jgi:hypothetical protein
MDNFDVNIRKFNVSDLGENDHVLVIGHSGFGWQSPIKNIARFFLNFLNYNSKVIITSSPNRWKNFLPVMNFEIVSTNMTILLDNYWSLQKELIRKYGYKSNTLLLLLDDVLLTKERVVEEILRNGRHYNTTLIMGTSYTKLPPTLRTRFSCIFLSSHNVLYAKKLYSQYGGIFPAFESFWPIFQQLTLNNEFMVIDNRRPFYGNSLKEEIENRCYWFKPKNIYKEFCQIDWKNMQYVLRESILWRKLPKDLKQYMINFFYEYSF